MKRRAQKITMLTAYDATMARLFDRAGVDALLVGDSLGMVVLGHDTTLPVTLEEMIHHTTRRQPRHGARAGRGGHAVPDLSGHRQRSGPQRRPAAAGRRRRGGQARRRPARCSTSSAAWSTSAFRSWATSACCRSRCTRWAATRKRGDAAAGRRRDHRRRARPRGGGRVRHRARVDSRRARANDHAARRHSDHRHRRRSRLRRPDARQLRHARPVRPVRAVLRQAVRAAWGRDRRGDGGVHRGCPHGPVSGGARESGLRTHDVRWARS